MNNNRINLFTSESVSEGHPDKLCDQIADAVLDSCLISDKESRVACEVFATTGLVVVGGEITTNAYIDIQEIVRNVSKDIGYTDAKYGLDYNSVGVINVIHSQSPDISLGVSKGQGLYKEQGAGDQGMMFGYACNETPEFMPAPIFYAHKLLLKAKELRNNGIIPWLRPDAKSQVTLEYNGDKIKRIHSIVLSHQHSDEVSYDELKDTIINKIIKETLNSTGLIDDKTQYFINPTGRFTIGGPHGDTGLTGRKIIVDTYGGAGRHGGGSFSGKDPSKVDRSASYMARYIAKNIVATGITPKCEIQLSYAIGVPFPISILVDTFGYLNDTAETKLEQIVSKVFNLSPEGIIETLDLKKPIYKETSNYGHFGKGQFSWEKLDKVDEIKSLL